MAQYASGATDAVVLVHECQGHSCHFKSTAITGGKVKLFDVVNVASAPITALDLGEMD